MLRRHSEIRARIRDFAAEESAQATTEYVLILAVLVSIALLLVRDLIRPILATFTDSISDAIENGMFNPDSMHRLPFKK